MAFARQPSCSFRQINNATQTVRFTEKGEGSSIVAHTVRSGAVFAAQELFSRNSFRVDSFVTAENGGERERSRKKERKPKIME